MSPEQNERKWECKWERRTVARGGTCHCQKSHVEKTTLAFFKWLNWTETTSYEWEICQVNGRMDTQNFRKHFHTNFGIQRLETKSRELTINVSNCICFIGSFVCLFWWHRDILYIQIKLHQMTTCVQVVLTLSFYCGHNSVMNPLTKSCFGFSY